VRAVRFALIVVKKIAIFEKGKQAADGAGNNRKDIHQQALQATCNTTRPPIDLLLFITCYLLYII
jgi:hypothetical protein